VKVLYVYGHWLDLNSIEDLDRAGDFAHGIGQPVPLGGSA
jgi:hypothetical protein